MDDVTRIAGAGIRGTGAALAVALLIALCGCSTDSRPDGSGGSAAPKGRVPTASPTGTPAASASGGGAGPADEAAARARVTADWQKFFSSSTSPEDRTELLQGGKQLQLVVQAFAHDPRAEGSRATVSSVVFTSPTAADVTYDVAVRGRTVLPHAKGTSVLEHGTWKVSVTTLCALLGTGGSGAPKDGTAAKGC
jgi:hypothetical protein